MPPLETLRRVGLVAPAWPPGGEANGIVAYVDGLRAGFRTLGIESQVFANRLGTCGASEEAVDVQRFQPALVPVVARRAIQLVTRRWDTAWWLGRRIAAAVMHTPIDTQKVVAASGQRKVNGTESTSNGSVMRT